MSISLESARAILATAVPSVRRTDRTVEGHIVPRLSAAAPRFRWTTAIEGGRPRLVMRWS